MNNRVRQKASGRIRKMLETKLIRHIEEEKF